MRPQSRSALVFVSILSASYLQSDWCRREFALFAQAAQARGHLRIGTKSCILKVIKTPVDQARQVVATFDISDFLGYPFFRTQQNGRYTEFDPDLGDESRRKNCSMRCRARPHPAATAATRRPALRSTSPNSEPTSRPTPNAPDAARVASASRDATVRLWDAATGSSIVLRGHAGSVTSAAFSADGRRVVSTSDDNTVRMWDVATGKQLCRLVGHYYGATTAAFSPDGLLVASGGADKTVRLWYVRRAHPGLF